MNLDRVYFDFEKSINNYLYTKRFLNIKIISTFRELFNKCLKQDKPNFFKISYTKIPEMEEDFLNNSK